MAQGKKAPRWSLATHHRKARRVIEHEAGLTMAEHEEGVTEPVERARRRVEVSAPALVKLAQALTLGTSPEELDRMRGGVRIMADLAVRQLAAVGIRSGESIEVDTSERMQQFLSSWFEGDHRKVIDVTPSREELIE